jgi:putative transcriptional regulator
MIAPAKGKILISEPFLPDPNFHRSVILLVEHDENGSLGYVLNQPTGLVCQDLFEDFNCRETVFLGGPVGRDYFHMLHTYDKLEEAVEIMPGLYRGGDFEAVKFLYNEGLTDKMQFRFFAGYSGWGTGQLEEEILQKSWIVVDGDPAFVFSSDPNLWKQVLRERGKEFAWLSNAPDDVNLN